MQHGFCKLAILQTDADRKFSQDTQVYTVYTVAPVVVLIRYVKKMLINLLSLQVECVALEPR